MSSSPEKKNKYTVQENDFSVSNNGHGIEKCSNMIPIHPPNLLFKYRH